MTGICINSLVSRGLGYTRYLLYMLDLYISHDYT